MKRHLRIYKDDNDTDSKLAAYIADGIEALQFRWTRPYSIIYTPPEKYEVTPSIASKDKRPIILMASIIYKMGNLQLANFQDQDFSYNPQQGRQNPIQVDVEELARFLPIYRLAPAMRVTMDGYANIYNRESYNWVRDIGIILP